MAIADEINNGINAITSFVEENPIATAAGIGAVAVGAGVVGAAVIGAASKKSSRKVRRKIKHTRRGWKLDRKRFNKSQKWEVAYRRRKKRASKPSKRIKGKKIHYTRKGQPYIILSTGKARFIKKRKGRKS